MTAAAAPSRDDGETMAPARRCAGCGSSFAPTGRAVHCSNACRKRVFRARRRKAEAAAPVAAPPVGSRREHTVYECPQCGQRQLAVQRCTDCGRFGRALGFGGQCPACGEALTLADLDLAPAGGAS
jgi:predicted RNA-binding Zn-ribbon protein involved in translation (DUF1610 family)